ncbi:SMP-30/gluconolactonase/LRE family protein [Methylobacterium sp. NEAU 140]|uniref:SMP-30/gluconolactonase/LRE family protein n=1 Tax=Methylobacterium sp. NEAU 140 TaxID=3064945 RepID=UPI002732FF05|nr:SMP-30/gluconolactonase/LRE family protein [Methylobacterium sp. NEAU 140]MDP4022032.1 SMP-30/gluconolactonase/LRE family protein [Methylobacterium sp. NEAU 140]
MSRGEGKARSPIDPGDVRRGPVRIDRRALIGAGLALAATGARAAAPVVRVDDPRLEAVLEPRQTLRTLYRGGRWCEGPCWLPHRAGLAFSDVKRNHILLLTRAGEVETLVAPSNNANGNTLDARGRLITCEHRGRRVVRRDPDGAVTVLADSFAGKPLNAPNDAVLGPDGAIWFTDPVYGIAEPEEGIQAEPEQRARRVYRIPEPGRVEAMTAAVDQPNGLAFAPDGKTLYVAESGAARNPEGGRAILAFPVEADRLGAPRVFAALEAGVPDGLKVDLDGRVYAACIDGVRIFDPAGVLLGRVATPTTAANLAFGGPDDRTLFITAGSAVHAIELRAPALRRF